MTNSNRVSLPIDLTNQLSHRLTPIFQNKLINQSIPQSSSQSNLIHSNSPSNSISISTSSNSNNQKNLIINSNSSNLSNSIQYQNLSCPNLNLVTFEFLFSEFIRYTQIRVDGTAQFEKKLNILGYKVGNKLSSLLILRDALAGSPNLISTSSGKLLSLATPPISSASSPAPIRLTRLVPALSWVHSTLWKFIMGKTADVLEHSNENENEYMISDNDLLLTRSISIPKEISQLSCGAYMAGIVEGALDSLGFPSRVTSHSAPSIQFPKRTTLLIKFEQSCINREKNLST